MRKADRHIRLVVFLLGTVGIVFFVMLLARGARGAREGFQVLTAGGMDANTCSTYRNACPQQTIGGQQVYMCPTVAAAMNLMKCDDTIAQSMRLDPSYQSQLGIRDAVCYLVGAGSGVPASRVESNYYVCYQRPPFVVYDDTLGSDVFQDPEEDRNPETMKASLESACGSYQGAGVMIGTSMEKTYNNIDYVSTAMRSIKGTYDQVAALRSQRCTGSLTTDQTKACNALAAFGTLQNDANYTALTTLYNTLVGSYSNMRTFFTGDTDPKFRGLKCKPLPATTISSITRTT